MAPRLALGVSFPSVSSLLSVSSVKGVYVTGQKLGFLQPFQGLMSLARLRRAGGRWTTIHSGGLDVSLKVCVLKVLLGMVRGAGKWVCFRHGLAPMGP